MNVIETTIAAGHLIFAIDILGTIAFAISGVLRGWQTRFNFVGVAFLAAATACGGGTIRDILGGKPVPFFLQEHIYFSVIIVTVLILYAGRWGVRELHRKCSWDGFKKQKHTMAVWLEVCDAFGLAVFAIIGARFAMTSLGHDHIAPFITMIGNPNPYQLQWFSVILFAILTGTGGGIVRDVVANRTPYAFASSYYAAFPALGGVLFWLLFALGDGRITVSIIAIPTVIVAGARLLHWHFYEYEREQFSAVVLFRDEEGHYLMEEGRSGYLSLIGGKWKPEDGSIETRDTLRNTATREAMEELGYRVPPEKLKRIPIDGKRDRQGDMIFRERSLRTGEVTRYHIAVFDYPERLTQKEMNAIDRFRERPVIARDRVFARVDPRKISVGTDPKSAPKEGVIELSGKPHPISYSLLKRIKDNMAKNIEHPDSSTILPDLPAAEKSEMTTSRE